jgi:hypothetical protein
MVSGGLNPMLPHHLEKDPARLLAFPGSFADVPIAPSQGVFDIFAFEAIN